MKLERNPITRRLLKRLLELEDKIVGKPFPGMRRIRQISTYACGPAVIESLLSFLKFRVSQKAVIRTLRAQRKIQIYGINVGDMGRAVNSLGKNKFVFWKKANSKVSDISTVIDKYKYPVGIEWQGVFYENQDEDSGHYSIITKVDQKTGFLRLADSYFNYAFGFGGVDRKFKINDFTQRWWDINLVGRRNVKDVRMMFVITPKGESWPKKLGMKRV